MIIGLGVLVATAASFALIASKVAVASITAACILGATAATLSGAGSKYDKNPLSRAPAVESHFKDDKYECFGERIVKYDAHLLARLSVLGIFKHTILCDRNLVVESLVLAAISLVVAGATVELGATTDIHRITHLASRLEGFVKYVGGFNTFFLGMYTSTSIARWWRLRTDGVGAIWSSSSRLSALLAAELCMPLDDLSFDKGTTSPRESALLGSRRKACSTLSGSVEMESIPDTGTSIRDHGDAGRIVANVHRYARASLRLIFSQKGRGSSMEHALQELQTLGHLEEEEIRLLRTIGSNLAEAIWSWTLALLMKLKNAKRIAQDDGIPWWQYIECWQAGRSGAALIGSQISSQLPFQYVHFISVVVKISNLQFSITMGILLGVAFRTLDPVDMFIALMSALVIPMINNAVLVLNIGFENPFGTDMTDFPEYKYIKDMRTDSLSYVHASRNLPAWSREDWS